MINQNRFENYLYESNSPISIFEDPSKPSVTTQTNNKEILNNLPSKKFNAYIPLHFIYSLKNIGIKQVEDIKSDSRYAVLLVPFCLDYVKIKLNFETFLLLENNLDNKKNDIANFPSILVENLSNFLINNNLSSISKDLGFYPKFNLEKIMSKWDFSKSLSIIYLIEELLNQITSWHIKRLFISYKLSQSTHKHKLGSLMNNKIQLIYNINEYLISKEINYKFCFNRRNENDTYFSVFSYELDKSDTNSFNKENNKIDIIINMSVNDSSVKLKSTIKNVSSEEIIPYDYINKIREYENLLLGENLKKEKRKNVFNWIVDLSKIKFNLDICLLINVSSADFISASFILLKDKNSKIKDSSIILIASFLNDSVNVVKVKLINCEEKGTFNQKNFNCINEDTFKTEFIVFLSQSKESIFKKYSS